MLFPHRTFLLLAALLLIAGCANLQGGSTNPNPAHAQNTSAPNQSAPMPCSEYCDAQLHSGCTGKWFASGAYPSCDCVFQCDQASGNANQSNAPGTNTTMANQTQGNGSQTQPGSNPAQNMPLTNVSAIIDAGLTRIRHDFYSSRSGSFLERSYTWNANPEAPPGEIGLSYQPTDVKFDGKAINSILASGFYVFTDKSDDSRYTSGLAIFRGTDTALDAYGFSDTFSIDYFPSIIDKKLRGCTVSGKDFSQDENGWLVTYSFGCAQALDK